MIVRTCAHLSSKEYNTANVLSTSYSHETCMEKQYIFANIEMYLGWMHCYGGGGAGVNTLL
jgi:hypothetical protein